MQTTKLGFFKTMNLNWI